MNLRCMLAVPAVLMCVLVLPAAASAAVALDTYKAPDGTQFTVKALTKMTGDRTTFTLSAKAPEGVVYGVSGELSRAKIHIAGTHYLQVGSGLACTSPGASAVFGTVLSGARKMVATFRGGKKLKLKLRTPPKAWRFRGKAFGGIYAKKRPVTKVTAYDGRGRGIAVARFVGAKGCA